MKVRGCQYPKIHNAEVDSKWVPSGAQDQGYRKAPQMYFVLGTLKYVRSNDIFALTTLPCKSRA